MVANVYETDELLSQYLVFHYANENDQLPWDFGPNTALSFPQRCIEEGLDETRLRGNTRGLDIGCAVGRSAYAMAKHCDEVVAIDYSYRFIQAANDLKDKKELTIELKQTGELSDSIKITAPAGRDKIRFMQGDAMNLSKDLGFFDVILAANLLCRLAEPQKFLCRVRSLLRPGGQLIITTPNTWLETFTAKDYWIGGTPETGEPLEALKKDLSESFILDKSWDMPFLIREHIRKYQWSVAQASRWIRRS